MNSSPRQIQRFVAAAVLLLLAGCGGRIASMFPWTQSQPAAQAAAQPPADSRLEHVTSATFDERVARCEKPVLVDFYATWCPPCQKLGPLVEQFATEHPEIRVVKINVDENHDLAARFEVKAMPTLIFFRGGQVANRHQGFVPKVAIEEMTAAAPQSVARKATPWSQ